MRPLVAAATAVLLCLGMASGASAAPREFYGVVTAEDPSDADFARMGAGQVGTLRINFVWAGVQGGPGFFYDWSRYDRLVGLAALNGIRVLPTVYSSPLWAAPTPEHPPLGHLPEFAAFVRAAVERYGANGTFWAANPHLPRFPIIAWQLWNESNSPSFWQPRPNPGEYVQLLRAFHGAVKGVDPSAQVVLAGLFRTPRIENGIFLRRYLPALYRRKAKKLFDAAAVHPYASTPKEALEAVKETRKIMRRFKDRKTPLWLTEVGWATPGGQRSRLTVGFNRQAKYLRRTFKLTARNRKRLKIAGVTWFSLEDIPGSAFWVGYTGLFMADGSPKPSWNAFVGLTGGRP